MANFEIRIEDHSNEIRELFQNRLETALETVGAQAESHAKQVITDTLVYGNVDLITVASEKDNSRVDTGRMRNSVAHTVVQNEVYIGSNLEYAVYHELGTGIYASQPGGRQTSWIYTDNRGKTHRTQGLYPIHFLKKAASEHTEEYKEIIERVLKGRR